jgi:hypothetical protein
MALALGLENKRKVVAAIVLFAALIGVTVWFFSGPPAPPPPPAQASPAQTPATSSAASGKAPAEGIDAEKLTNAGIDPALHFDKLAQSEDVRYEGTGRNIFSAESAPMPLPKPIAPPRPSGPAAVALNAPPPPPKPPAVDIKYFGYEQDKDKTLRAFFLHGDDVFIARTGEIVDHRYRVGIIRPGSVEIVDLSYNDTQTLSLSSF